jgi:hypothetical protein
MLKGKMSDKKAPQKLNTKPTLLDLVNTVQALPSKFQEWTLHQFISKEVSKGDYSSLAMSSPRKKTFVHQHSVLSAVFDSPQRSEAVRKLTDIYVEGQLASKQEQQWTNNELPFHTHMTEAPAITKMSRLWKRQCYHKRPCQFGCSQMSAFSTLQTRPLPWKHWVQMSNPNKLVATNMSSPKEVMGVSSIACIAPAGGLLYPRWTTLHPTVPSIMLRAKNCTRGTIRPHPEIGTSASSANQKSGTTIVFQSRLVYQQLSNWSWKNT